MKRLFVSVLMFTVAAGCQLGASAQAQSGTEVSGRAARRPVIYVMPNATTNPGGTDSQVVVDSSHNGKEPQVAKIYQELQHRKECQAFSENMIKEKADYFLLLQHGGGKGNRWAVSNKEGEVIASGDSMMLGSSVKDACVAMAKNWQESGVSKANGGERDSSK